MTDFSHNTQLYYIVCKLSKESTLELQLNVQQKRFLQPEKFNIEMYLKFNLGPLHLLDTFVKEILASDSSQSYLRKEQAKKRRLVTNDLNKSAAMETIEKRIEKSLIFRHCFGKILLSKVYNCVLCEKPTKLFYY